jgi:protein-L-isoaspartate(D-aspartate) O-methyltransferase
MKPWSERARRMIETQIRARGIFDSRILSALERVDRTEFVPEDLAPLADADGPLPIGEGQTVSQPFMVALMTDLLALPERTRVLEIGTGSGYQAAILAEMGMEVVSVERIGALACVARERLARLGYRVLVIHGDGRLGFPGMAPYGAVLVTAAAPRIEKAWTDQLAEGGRLVVPLVIQPGLERLLVRVKTGSGFQDSWSEYCRFVPLLPGTGEDSSENNGPPEESRFSM